MRSDRASLIMSAGYGLRLGDYSFVPSAGLAVSATRTSRLTYQDGGTLIGTLDTPTYTSVLGFASATLSRTFVMPDQVSKLTPFVTGSIYNEFGGDVNATYTPAAGSARQLQMGTLQTFGEVSVGMNYGRAIADGAIKQFDAGIRGDFKFGNRVESIGVTAQMRFMF